MHNCTLWSLGTHFSIFLYSLLSEQRVSAPHYIALAPSSIGACRKWDIFLVVPPWPGNYPNLPSSCAPAPVPHWLRPPLWLHYQCWDSLMAWRPRCAGCWQRGTMGKEEKKRQEKEEEREEKKWDSKEQGAALEVNISIMRDNTGKSNGFSFLKSHRSVMEDEAIGLYSVREEVRRSAKVLSAGQNDRRVCVCEVTSRRVHVCVPLTQPHLACLKLL